jgi:EAL domain
LAGEVHRSFLSSESTEADTTALAEHQLITALRDWSELSAAGPTLRTAVNVSISVLGNLHLPALVRNHRPKSEKWPGLILELTEEEVVKDLDLVHEIATQLRIWGITLAIADFGEGFSSFARMRELPFSELKLDGGFVGGCADDARNAGICRDHRPRPSLRRGFGGRRPGKPGGPRGHPRHGLPPRPGFCPGRADAQGAVPRRDAQTGADPQGLVLTGPSVVCPIAS